MPDVMKQLDLAKEKLTDARKHAEGRQTDSCLHETIRAVAEVEDVVRLIVRAYRGDEVATAELAETED